MIPGLAHGRMGVIGEDMEHELIAWLITDENINHLQVSSIQRLIDRCKHAHHVDIHLRINGQDEVVQADWLKFLGPRHIALHASAPKDHKCADCTMDREPCPTCYHAWWTKRYPNTHQIGGFHPTINRKLTIAQIEQLINAGYENLLSPDGTVICDAEMDKLLKLDGPPLEA